MPNVTIEIASVKVMRSHDYCHFEVNLSSSSANSVEAVDELRKAAARLADKAVAQYRIAKVNAQRILGERNQRQYLIERMGRLKETSEDQLTPEEKAELKAYKDAIYVANRPYDYEDDWDQDSDS
jgi:hypothetical protein